MRCEMKDVLVSVVMPAYNCEKYIGQAIRSVLEQTVSLELIIVEDKSGDGTEAVICEFLDGDGVGSRYLPKSKSLL